MRISFYVRQGGGVRDALGCLQACALPIDKQL
jgi:hypothetical protein